MELAVFVVEDNAEIRENLEQALEELTSVTYENVATQRRETLRLP